LASGATLPSLVPWADMVVIGRSFNGIGTADVKTLLAATELKV
jgi:hypothetical protein